MQDRREDAKKGVISRHCAHEVGYAREKRCAAAYPMYLVLKGVKETEKYEMTV